MNVMRRKAPKVKGHALLSTEGRLELAFYLSGLARVLRVQFSLNHIILFDVLLSIWQFFESLCQFFPMSQIFLDFMTG
jgi:hypothetical protein